MVYDIGSSPLANLLVETFESLCFNSGFYLPLAKMSRTFAAASWERNTGLSCSFTFLPLSCITGRISLILGLIDFTFRVLFRCFGMGPKFSSGFLGQW